MKKRGSRQGPAKLGLAHAVMALSCVAVMMTALGCATVGIEMRQEVTAGPPGVSETGSRSGNCEQCIPPPVYHGSLQIHDPDLTTWMVVNNTFIFPVGAEIHEHDVRFGVLLQLGSYDEPGDILDQVSVDGLGFCVRGLTKCSSGHPDFAKVEWINIVPAGSDPDIFMRGEDLYHLYPKADTSNECTAFDTCTESPCGSNSTPPGIRCLRLRRLHAEFEATGVMTYWFGQNGYDLAVTQPEHPDQIFKFKDPVDVYVYMEPANTGEDQPCPGGEPPFENDPVRVCKYHDAEMIQLIGRHDPSHGSYHDPPMGR